MTLVVLLLLNISLIAGQGRVIIESPKELAEKFRSIRI